MSRSKIHRSVFRAEIRAQLSLGVPSRRVARDYGLSKSAVHDYRTRMSASELEAIRSAAIADLALKGPQ